MAGKYDSRVTDFIKDHVDIVDLVSRYVQLKRAGRNLKGLCPFHNEKTPSFVVSEDRGNYHCFGCQASGNVISFAMEIENLDFLDALEFLADQYHLDLAQFRTGKVDRERLDKRELFYQMNREAAIFYYKRKNMHAEAMDYLKSRELSDETIKSFGLGFAPDAWNELQNSMKSKNFKESDLVEVGLLSKNQEKNKVYDRFRNRIIFPIMNQKGQVVGFGGRVMDDSLPKYLNSSESIVFNKSRTLYGLHLAKKNLSKTKTAIVVEGYMDVIALHQAGVTNAVATLGTALTVEHGNLLNRYADEIILCFDSDQAGIKATTRSIEVLKNVVKKLKVLTLGVGKDPDEFIKLNGLEAFNERVNAAVSYIEYILDQDLKHFNISSNEGKIDYVKKVKPFMQELNNEVEKSIYTGWIAERLNLTKDVVSLEIYGYTFNDGIEKPEVPKVTSQSNEKKVSAIHVYMKKAIKISLSSVNHFEVLYRSSKGMEHLPEWFYHFLETMKAYYSQFETYEQSNLIQFFEMNELKIIDEAYNFDFVVENNETTIYNVLVDIQKQTVSDEIKEVDSQLKVTNEHDSSFKELFLKKHELNKIYRDLRYKRREVN